MELVIKLTSIEDNGLTIEWNSCGENCTYNVYWADKDTETMQYKLMTETDKCSYTLNKSTHIPQYLKVGVVCDGKEVSVSEVFKTPVKRVMNRQLEKLSRGLIAIKSKTGIFLSWRLMLDEVNGYNKTGMTGADFAVYRNGVKIAVVEDSTNYIDKDGKTEDEYQVAAINNGVEDKPCKAVKAWSSNSNYIEIPMVIPKGGVTPAGNEYEYTVNDMSIADVDGDGEYEYIVKWDPTNSQDVSIKGYTGKCFIDCYKLDGRLMWRLDMGKNIRAGAHYTQFIVFDFDGDGKAEMSVKTAPGTKMTIYDEAQNIVSEKYITMPQKDIEAGYSHEDDYVCSAEDYYEHMVKVFMDWTEHPEVKCGNWCATLEECFGIENKYNYPLCEADARELVDYFIDVFAPSRSAKNDLRHFEGFIYEGPEYLTMFAGNGEELETIPFKYDRIDDGLMWGDYAMNRIEPCNRVDRFLSGVAYLDGERPYLIICRGYYTRATIVAYDFFEGKHREYFAIDSGFVPMRNPFNDRPHDTDGTDKIYGCLAGQGNHSLSTADVDGDGNQEIIYGAAVIDHDGSVLYSSRDIRPDGVEAKLGHGDAMHVACIDPDRPGLEIFNVFEGAKSVPYGYALRDAETGKVIFGEYAECDLGRCMIGDINKDVRGLQVWVKEVFDCKGNKLPDKLLGTNQSIKWAADLTTQITDGVDYINEKHRGIVNDNIHGIMLKPEGTLTNNGTKGNPCLIADVFGDFREEIILRTEDNSAIRIYSNDELTNHKLFTLMHDTMYRTSVAWQNNCYNQPGYTSFYYASDMDFADVLPELKDNKKK